MFSVLTPAKVLHVLPQHCCTPNFKGIFIISLSVTFILCVERLVKDAHRRHIGLFNPMSAIEEEEDVERFYDYQDGVEGYESDAQDETDDSDFQPMPEYEDSDEE